MRVSTGLLDSRPARDPLTAALLSMLPGLGQLYNGERRKGILFLDAAFINLAMLWIIFFTDSVTTAVGALSRTVHAEPSRLMLKALAGAHFGSPLSLIMLGLVMAFFAYAVRDAYDHALYRRRSRLYPDQVIAMPEATSGSYLFHFALMMSLVFLALFFVHPVKPPAQITEIQFVTTDTRSTNHVDAPLKSDKPADESGKHNPARPVSTGSASAAASSAPVPQPVRPQAPAIAATIAPPVQPASLAPTAQPALTQRVLPTAPPPMPQPDQRSVSPTAPLPMPTNGLTASASLRPAPLPMVSPQSPAHQIGAPGPQPVAASVGTVPVPPSPRTMVGVQSPATPAPAAAVSPGRQAGAAAPQPLLPGTGAGRPANAGADGGPAPQRMTGVHRTGGGAGPLIAAAPAGSAGQGGHGVAANPEQDGQPSQSPSPGVSDVNWGPYMADVQSRIRRSWFPPSDGKTKRVLVQFKVHRDGRMSHLRLTTASGLAIADQAALAAVQNASPFRPLPAGSPDDVDIQFTFDYNVFGGGTGSFRRF